MNKITSKICAIICAILIVTPSAYASTIDLFQGVNTNVGDGTYQSGWINDSYDFHAVDNVNIKLETAIWAHINIIVPWAKLSKLTLTWSLNDGGSLTTLATSQVTNKYGNIINPLFWQSLTANTDYVLTVQGKWLGLGAGHYNIALISNPLPPSVIAFSTAMIGIGFLMRRRKKKQFA